MFSIFKRHKGAPGSADDPGRFFRYVLGELLLLVVGILIALQIDGWREQRNDRAQEAYYLERLSDELQFNADEATRNIQFSQFQKDNAALLLKSLDSELDEQEQIEWLYALNHAWFLPHPYYSDATWSELKATGKLELLRNRDLVRRISAFHSDLAHTLRLEDEWGRFNLLYRDAVNNVLDDDLRVEVLDGIDNVRIEDRISRPVDVAPYIDRFRRLPGIEGLIRDIWINRSVGVQEHRNRLADIEEVRAQLVN